MRELLLTEKDERIKEPYRGDILKAEKQIGQIQREIEALEKVLETNKGAILTYAEFIELMEKIPKILAFMKDIKGLDNIIKKMYLNFTIRDNNVEKSTLAKPFAELYELKISNSGDGRNRTAV